ELFQRAHQVAAQRAAQATALEQHHVVVDGLHQQMVEADLAELIDDDGGVGKRGVGQQAIEERCLAGAQEAGQHGQRNGFGRSVQARSTRFHHFYCCGCGCGWCFCGGGFCAPTFGCDACVAFGGVCVTTFCCVTFGRGRGDGDGKPSREPLAAGGATASSEG